MGLIERDETFRGRIVDHGVSKTTNRFPQLVLSLLAMEIYDTEVQEWVDWSSYGLDEITAYLCLFGGKGETLTCKQVKEITGWDGNSFATLAAMDLSEVQIQFRTAYSTFEEKTRLGVEWVDVYDAVPGRSVKKLDAAELKSLDAEYANMLKQSGKTKAPVKAGKVTKKGVSPTQAKGPVTKKKESAKITNPIEAPVEEVTQAPTLKGPPSGSPSVAKEAENAVSGSCTKDEAWYPALDLKKTNMSDEVFSNFWLGAINEVAPGIEQENITNEQWYGVRTIMLEKVSAV